MCPFSSGCNDGTLYHGSGRLSIPVVRHGIFDPDDRGFVVFTARGRRQSVISNNLLGCHSLRVPVDCPMTFGRVEHDGNGPVRTGLITSQSTLTGGTGCPDLYCCPARGQRQDVLFQLNCHIIGCQICSKRFFAAGEPFNGFDEIADFACGGAGSVVFEWEFGVLHVRSFQVGV